MGGICWRTIPGPLSITVTRKRVAWLAGGGAAPLLDATSRVTTTSGRIPASSAASSALSTASFTQVRRAFRGLSKPRRCRFLVKNSETEISRWRAPISTAETAGFGGTVPDAASAVGISLLDIRRAARARRLSAHGRRPPRRPGRLHPSASPWYTGLHPRRNEHGQHGAQVRVDERQGDS